MRISLSYHDIIFISGTQIEGSDVSQDQLRARAEELVDSLKEGVHPGTPHKEKNMNYDVRELGLLWREAIPRRVPFSSDREL